MPYRLLHVASGREPSGENTRGFVILLIWLVFALSSPAACFATGDGFADQITLRGRTMGTTFVVKARGPSAGNAHDSAENPLADTIAARLDQIDERMSTWRDDSEVSRFNRAPADQWFDVSDETAQVVRLAQDVSAASEGAFDITVAPLLALWNFGAAAKADTPKGTANAGSDTVTSAFKLPTDAELQQARTMVGYQRLQVRLDPPALRKDVAGLQIDLSGIAKGYAVDALCGELDAAGYEHYMVEVGGEVRVRGTTRDGSPWRIGVEEPTINQREVKTIVRLAEQAMATSGDYRNFYQHQGKLYSHTIAPDTGRPVEHTLAAVTVLSESCALADARATALLVKGPVQGLAWARQQGIQALFLERTPDGVRRISTDQFPSHTIVPTTESALNGLLPMLGITAIIFGIAMLAMSVGTIIANRRIKGSCGGLAGFTDAQGRSICEACTNPSPECSGLGAELGSGLSSADTDTDVARSEPCGDEAADRS